MKPTPRELQRLTQIVTLPRFRNSGDEEVHPLGLQTVTSFFVGPERSVKSQAWPRAGWLTLTLRAPTRYDEKKGYRNNCWSEILVSKLRKAS